MGWLYRCVYCCTEIPVRCRQIQYVLHLSTPHLRAWYGFFFSLCPWRRKSSLTAPARPEPLYRLRFILDCMRNLFCLVVLKCIFMFKSVFVNPENFYCFVGRDRTRRGLVELIHISNGFGEIRVRTDAPREVYC